MTETKLPYDFQREIDNNHGLSRYLSGLSNGREATPRSNLYNLPGKTALLEPDEILQSWISILDVLKSKDAEDVEVFQFDSHQLEKWGPQGAVAPIDDLLDDVVYPSFLEGMETPAFSDSPWKQAKAIVTRKLMQLGCKSLRPLGYTRVLDDMRARDTLESNSGWPLFTRRSKPEVIAQSREEAEDGRWKTYPAIALFRNYNRKTRLVWMFPMSANLVEGSFFQPLLHILVKSGERFLSPWVGFEEVKSAISRVYSRKSNSILASDFSSTDAHFKLATSMEVCEVLAPCFQPEYRDALKESIHHMHTIPLLVGINKMLTGEHGVSSGSNWTNFIETIFDWILAEYVRISTSGQQESLEGLCAIGDDMSWIAPSNADFERLPDTLAQFGKNVGQEINAEKVTAEISTVKFLQRLFQRSRVDQRGRVKAAYSTIRALKSLVYPERFHKPELWSKDMEAIRAIMILENCIDHPLYERFVKFVSDGDPNLAAFAKRPKSIQAKLQRESKLIPGLNPTYNQEKRDTGIEQFRTIQVLAGMN